jgi:hypothetical protein
VILAQDSLMTVLMMNAVLAQLHRRRQRKSSIALTKDMRLASREMCNTEMGDGTRTETVRRRIPEKNVIT